MGMSNYIIDVEENFWDIVSNFVKDADHYSDASEKAVILGKNMVPFIDTDDIEEGVNEMWNEFWSNYP